MSSGIVNNESQSTAFTRKWDPPYAAPGTPNFPRPDPPPEPLVRCRDAQPDEIPDAAMTSAAAAAQAGWHVRVTYAQGGKWRSGPDRGVCPFCFRAVLLFADDGTLREHVRPAVDCPGGTVLQGHCTTCGKKTAAKKNGETRAHQKPGVKCPGGHQEPARVIPGEPIPPPSSVVVRVYRPNPPRHTYAAGVWSNGEFEIAFVHDGTKFAVADADEFKRKVRVRSV